MGKYLAAVLIGLLLVAGAVLWQVAGESGGAQPIIQTDTTAPQPPGPLGVTVALERYSDQQRAQTLDALAAAGMSWIRQRFPWDAIEPAPGEWDWSEWDSIVTAATTRGLTLVAVLDGSPAWARTQADAANPLAPPVERADFGRFVAAFARRYGDRMRFYQVWDEPNIAPHWGSRPADAADYGGLLREAAVQLRSADSDAVVLSAALAPNTEPGGINQSDVAFLDSLYEAGAAPWFDVAAAEPYGFERAPADPPDPAALNFRRAELLRDVMQKHGDEATPLWASAFGWHAPLDGSPSRSGPWASVDQATQAQWAVEAMEWARRHWPWAGGLAWAWWQPPDPVGAPSWGLAMVTPAGASRPVLSQLSQWAQQVHALGAGAWPPNSASIEAGGDWRLTSQGADPPTGAKKGNNWLRIPFDGASLALDIQRGPYWGYFEVLVDGKPANALPRDEAGRAYLLLHDPLGGREVVQVATGLADGPHEAELVATGGWGQWPLLAIHVGRRHTGPQVAYLPWVLALTGAAALIAGLAGLARGRTPRPAWQAPTRVRVMLQAVQGLPPATRLALLVALALGSAFSPWWLQPLLLAALFVLLVAAPQAGLALVAVTTPLFLLRVPVLRRPVNPAELAVWLTAGAVVARWLLDASQAQTRQTQREPWTSRLGSLDWAVIALLAISILATLAASKRGVALHEWRTVILAGVLAYAAVRLAPVEADGLFDPWSVTWGIGIGATIVAIWGIAQAVGRVDVIQAEGVARVRGPYGSPNNLALYLDHALPIMLAVAVLASQRGRRLAAALASAIILVALVLTFSRGALLLGVPAAVLFLGFAAGGRWRWLAVGAVAVGGLLVVPLFRTDRFAGLLDLQAGTGFLRMQLWRGAWNMVREHPWLGVGPDNFLYAYRTRYATPAAWQELNLSHPHNIVLDFWTRLGLPGLLVGVWLFVAAFRQGWQGLQRLAGDRRALMLGLLASLIATLAHGLIDNSVFLVDLMLLLMLTLGLIVRLDRDADQHSP